MGIAAFAGASGGVVWVVSGRNGENLMRAEGATSAAAWQAALNEAQAVGMVPGWRISRPGVG